MKPAEAIRELMLRSDDWHGDCADLAIAYVSRVWGKPIERPQTYLSVAAVKSVLGKPRRGKPVYGDLILHRGGLGIFLSYALFTVDHASKKLARIDVPDDSMIAWRVDNG